MDKLLYFYKGRIALFALLKAFGIGSGDRVLIPGYTCMEVPLTVKYVGAILEYADIDTASYNSPLKQYQNSFLRMEEHGTEKQLVAVIIQHTYGNPNRDTQAITAWAKEKGLIVIEDCAHVNGVSIDGNPAGSFGDAAFYSTHWSKPFTTGYGGIAQINNPKYAGIMVAMEKAANKPGFRETATLAMRLAAHQFLLQPKLYRLATNAHWALAKMGINVGSSTVQDLNGEMPRNYFKGMSQMQKKLLDKRGAQMDKVNDYRRWLAKEYSRLLTERGLPAFSSEEGAVLIRYPIRVKDKATCLRHAKLAKVEMGNWFDHPLYPAGNCSDDLFWDDERCPNAISAAQEVITLPVQSGIGYREINNIIDFISDFALTGQPLEQKSFEEVPCPQDDLTAPPRVKQVIVWDRLKWSK